MKRKCERKEQQLCITFEERMGENRNAYRILVEKPKGKKALRRPGRRWCDNIKWNLTEIGLVGRD
jgi:hypothetical protein